tara:strand:+ start:81 stop:686 length:606 start_codon:yes stop_codon:yes gene_type:complete
MPNLRITKEARTQILAALEQQEPQKSALRLEATTNGTAEFAYGMRLVDADDLREDDEIVESKGVKVLVDPASARNLEGATVDYEDGILQSGFRFDNPNKPNIPELGEGPRADLSGPTAEKVEQLINTEINSAVAAHGGQVNFLGVKENRAYLTFGGGCHGCGMVDVTLKQGIEARIKELVPEIEEVVDVTDHSAGENPFYR